MISRLWRLVGIIFLGFLLLTMFAQQSFSGQEQDLQKKVGNTYCEKLIDLDIKNEQEVGTCAGLNSFVNVVSGRKAAVKKAQQELVEAAAELVEAKILQKKLSSKPKDTLPEEEIIEIYKVDKRVESAEKKLKQKREKKNAAVVALKFSMAKMATIAAKGLGGYFGVAAGLGLLFFPFAKMIHEREILYGEPLSFSNPLEGSITAGLSWPLFAFGVFVPKVLEQRDKARTVVIQAKLEAELKLTKALLEKEKVLKKRDSLSREQFIRADYMINEEIKKAQEELDKARADENTVEKRFDWLPIHIFGTD